MWISRGSPVALALLIWWVLTASVASGVEAVSDPGPGPTDDRGADAVATAISSEPQNTATAAGGEGGAVVGRGGDGGDARAVAETVRSGAATARATAIGGEGSGLGNGGDAFASGFASNASANPVEVEVSARAGRAGRRLFTNDSFDGVASLGRVEGVSTGGGRVRVSAELIQAGATAELIDSARGDTAGELTLEQRAIGLAGDRDRDRDGADARNELSKETASHHLELVTFSRGGDGATVSPNFGGPDGGSGGDAINRVLGSNTAGSVRIDARAQGGDGQQDGSRIPGVAGDGGSASVAIDAHSDGDGNTVEIIGVALAGDSLSDPGDDSPSQEAGDASSRSVAIATGDSLVHVQDEAVGGTSRTGAGGDASSYAEGSNTGAQVVSVRAEATAGEGASSGQALARARGVSTGGGDVNVIAVQRVEEALANPGGSSEQRDAVTGGTSGLLVLEQTVEGGDGTSAGGSATAALSARNELGGDLHAAVLARGGGTDSNVPGFRGGDALIESFGFQGSAGRRVELIGEAVGGISEGVGGRGGDAGIVSRVEDSSAAELDMVLRSLGGRADGVGRSRPGGDGGAASLDVHVDTSSDELMLELEAIGGQGGAGTSASRAGAGGDARLLLDATNLVGRAHVVALSDAGGAGRLEAEPFRPDPERAADGGSAELGIVVRTGGDDSDIAIGTQSVLEGSGAFGGDGSSLRNIETLSEAGRGGSATSRSVGIAEGAAAVTIYDLATAGNATGAAQGGSASSTAHGESQGGDVLIDASARAGASGGTIDGATAIVDAFGASTAGSVTVRGTATGGFGLRAADVSLVNAVRGRTSGRLDLDQRAFAQGAGTATSLLEHTGSSSEMRLFSLAFGGDADARSSARNESGSADALATARSRTGHANAESRASALGAARAEAISLATDRTVLVPDLAATAFAEGVTSEATAGAMAASGYFREVDLGVSGASSRGAVTARGVLSSGVSSARAAMSRSSGSVFSASVGLAPVVGPDASLARERIDLASLVVHGDAGAGDFAMRLELSGPGSGLPAEDLRLTFSDAAGEGDIDEIRLLVSRADITFLDESFDSMGDAVAFFSEQTLELGDPSEPFRSATSILIELDVLTSVDWSLDVRAVVSAQVPEPGTGGLVVLGVLVLAARRNRARRPYPSSPSRSFASTE